MARRFTGIDVRNWKVCDRMGKPFRYPGNDKPMTDLNGFDTANALARALGGVAVRV